MYRLMEFYEIPKIIFAHKHTTTHYDQNFIPKPNCVEFTVTGEGTVIKEHEDGRVLSFAPRTLMTNVNDHCFHIYSPDSFCSHYTFAIEVEHSVSTVQEDDIAQTNHPLTAPVGGKAPMTVLLPEQLPLDTHNAYLEPLLRRVIEVHSMQTQVAQLRSIGVLMEFLAAMTEETIRSVMLSHNSFSPANILYVHRTMEYIATHLSEKLTVTELADHAQISPSYLSGLFKAYTGQSIIDYTNRIKVERVKEMLISQRGILLREAGESVGILDENYLSRLFKRYAGMSVRDFQHLHRPDGLQIPQAQA